MPGIGGIGAVPAVPNLAGMNLPAINPAAGLSQMFAGNQLQNTFGLPGQLAQLQLQQTQQQQAMSQLEALAGVAAASNSVAHSPQFAQSVTKLWQAAGLGKDPPLNPDGSINVQALSGIQDPTRLDKLASANYHNTLAATEPGYRSALETRDYSSAHLSDVRALLAPGLASATEGLDAARQYLAKEEGQLLPGMDAAREGLDNADAKLKGIQAQYEAGLMSAETAAYEGKAVLDQAQALVQPSISSRNDAQANYYNARVGQVVQDTKLAMALDDLARKGGQDGVFMKPSDYYGRLRDLDNGIRQGRSQLNADTIQLNNATFPPGTPEYARLQTQIQNEQQDLNQLITSRAKLEHRSMNYAHPIPGTRPLTGAQFNTQVVQGKQSGQSPTYMDGMDLPDGSQYWMFRDGSVWLKDKKSQRWINTGQSPSPGQPITLTTPNPNATPAPAGTPDPNASPDSWQMPVTGTGTDSETQPGDPDYQP